MLLKRTELDPGVVSALQKFNIRTVEQLRLIADNGLKVSAVSIALGVERNKLLQEIAGVVRQHPIEEELPKITRRKFPLGLRSEKNSDEF